MKNFLSPLYFGSKFLDVVVLWHVGQESQVHCNSLTATALILLEKIKQKSELEVFDNHFVQKGVRSGHSSWIAGLLQPSLQVLGIYFHLKWH